MRGLMGETMRIRLRHVLRDVDRYGNVRFYYRKQKGLPKVRLPDDDQSPAFLARYHALLSGVAAAVPAGGCLIPSAGTFRWLAVEHMRVAPFTQLAKKTRELRRGLLERMMAEPVRPDAPDSFGDMPLQAVTTKALKVLRDRQADRPEMANQRVKTLRRLFAWALEQEHIAADPARDLTKLKHKSAGHHTWTVEEVAQFEAKHPLGTKARLALALLLWTGVRRQDVVLLGKQHRCKVEGKPGLAFNTSKNGERVVIPILPCLQEVIDASPTGDLTFIVGSRGEPWDAHTFGNWFRGRCVEAGVPGRAHGLRKAGATTLAENGATPHQLGAIYGWRTLKEPERYTRAAQRKKMAGDAMELLVRKG